MHIGLFEMTLLLASVAAATAGAVAALSRRRAGKLVASNAILASCRPTD